MMGMPLHIGWGDVALRLVLTILAGVLIGYNRTEHGKAAGLRTTLFVGLAAALAMIQMNLLLPMSGRPTDSFVTNDLMRLPLGILTGVGFIGGGAILRRGDVVSGVTTAATLWFVTVVGLCFGGGQILLGAITTALGALVLWGLDWADLRMRALTLTLGEDGPAEAAIRRQLSDTGLVIRSTAVAIETQRRSYAYELVESRIAGEARVPAVVETLARLPGIAAVSWRTAG